MATKPQGGAGGRVAARFDGANQSEAALRALQGAGFRADQVAAEVYNPRAAEAQAGPETGGGGAVAVPILGAVLGALLGGVLGRAIVGGTTAILLAAIVGAVAGAAIALAIARAGASRSPASDAAGQRAGSVTLTVTPDSAEQARAARTTLLGHGGQELPAPGRGR